MARTPKVVVAPKAREGMVRLVVEVDPLAAPRGHRVLPRGAVHATDKRPGRAQSRQQFRRQLDGEGRPAPRQVGPLV